MNHDGAGQDETYCGCPLRMGLRLLFLWWHTDIVPEMHFALLHIDCIA